MKAMFDQALACPWDVVYDAGHRLLEVFYCSISTENCVECRTNLHGLLGLDGAGTTGGIAVNRAVAPIIMINGEPIW